MYFESRLSQPFPTHVNRCPSQRRFRDPLLADVAEGVPVSSKATARHPRRTAGIQCQVHGDGRFRRNGMQGYLRLTFRWFVFWPTACVILGHGRGK